MSKSFCGSVAGGFRDLRLKNRGRGGRVQCVVLGFSARCDEGCHSESIYRDDGPEARFFVCFDASDDGVRVGILQSPHDAAFLGSLVKDEVRNFSGSPQPRSG